MPELHRLATTIETWRAILAFLHIALSNARTGGLNRLVKQVRRVACGFRDTENSRRRIRLHRTRTQRASARFTTAQLPAWLRRAGEPGGQSRGAENGLGCGQEVVRRLVAPEVLRLNEIPLLEDADEHRAHPVAVGGAGL
ncbi:MAG: transposase [Mycolicibacterium sp.]|nr:transposase [Mycobacterium sp.]MCB9410231.1 transposase [Mycolicibacterium sp.]